MFQYKMIIDFFLSKNLSAIAPKPFHKLQIYLKEIYFPMGPTKQKNSDSEMAARKSGRNLLP